MTDLNQIKALVAIDLKNVDQVIIDACQSDVDLIQEISRHLINSGGKRIRPLLALLAARACNSTERHASFAAVIEFIHAATLLHDDVVDESNLRRGKSTANQQWGNQAAVLVGDFLYSRAFQLMAALNSLPIMKLMADTTNTIAAGEVMQLVDAHDERLTEDHYYKIIHAKTAILFSAACEGAGILANAPEAQQQALAIYGLNLGIAYQLTDDALDYTGNTATLGKTQGDDFTEGKLTLPLIHALANCDASDKAWLQTALQTPKQEDLQRVQGIIDATGSIKYTYQQVNHYCQLATDALTQLDDSEFSDGLADVLAYVTARQQ